MTSIDYRRSNLRSAWISQQYDQLPNCEAHFDLVTELQTSSEGYVCFRSKLSADNVKIPADFISNGAI